MGKPENQELICFDHKEYPSFHEIEEIKSKAWDGFEKCTTREKVFRLLEGVIWAHYWRARMNLEENKKFHTKVIGAIYGKGHPTKDIELCIDRYTNNWLYSMKDQLDLNEEVLELMEQEWGYRPVKNKYLQKGHTIYHMPEIKPDSTTLTPQSLN